MSWMALTMPPLNFPSKQHSASLAIDLPIGGKARTMLSAFLSRPCFRARRWRRTCTRRSTRSRGRSGARSWAAGSAAAPSGSPASAAPGRPPSPSPSRNTSSPGKTDGNSRATQNQCFIVRLDIFPYEVYRMILVVSELGRVDLDLRCSTILLGH